MNRSFKYIIIDGLYPRVFTEVESHIAVAGEQHPEVTSAGSGQLNIAADGKIHVSCWGKSLGLGKVSSPADAALIERMFVEPSF